MPFDFSPAACWKPLPLLICGASAGFLQALSHLGRWARPPAQAIGKNRISSSAWMPVARGHGSGVNAGKIPRTVLPASSNAPAARKAGVLQSLTTTSPVQAGLA